MQKISNPFLTKDGGIIKDRNGIRRLKNKKSRKEATSISSPPVCLSTSIVREVRELRAKNSAAPQKSLATTISKVSTFIKKTLSRILRKRPQQATA